MPGSQATLERTLTGKIAIVTGASRGIGRAIAARLAARGARVACIATSADHCAPTVAYCQALHAEPRADAGEARAYGVDVSDSAAVAELVEHIQKDFGGLDILINNAGVTRDQLLLRMSEEDFDRVIAVNLKGAWNFIRASARTLMKSRGRIVNVSSIVGITGNPGQSNYAASKAGLIGLTRSVALELASRGVCVNAIAPGFIATDMTASIDAGSAEALEKKIPLQRIGTPEEIAHAVDFLVSPGGGYVTGQVLVVDGGLSL